jgi:hypothetical protein
MDVMTKAGSKRHLASSPGSTIKNPDANGVAIFRETAKGMGKLEFDSHEAYIEELEERAQVNHQDSDLIEARKDS